MNDILYSEYDKINKFSGIIKNIADNSLVVTDYIKTFSTDPFRTTEGPENTLSSEYNFFTSVSTPDAFIAYYFPERKLLLKHYSIKTIDYSDYNDNFPRTWAILGSNNNRTWKRLDYRNTTVFTQRGQEETFDIKVPRAFRYYKMQQQDKNSQNQYYLRFRQIEFFGVLYSDKTGLDMICNGVRLCTHSYVKPSNIWTLTFAAIYI